MRAFLAVLCAAALLMPAPSVWAKTAPAKTTSHKTSPAKKSAPAKPSIFDPPLQTQKRTLPPGTALRSLPIRGLDREIPCSTSPKSRSPRMTLTNR